MRFIRREDPPIKVLKIIPHHTVLNSNTRKLQSSFHELLSIKNQMFPWQHGKGWYIAIRPSPSLWWITRIEKKTIEYYAGVPEDLVESFKIKIDNFEHWKKCTVEVVDEFEFPATEDTDLYSMRYEKHDMFSLNFDYKEQHVPVADIMRISNELKEDESLNLFIRTEAFDVEKWKKISDYGWTKWDKGAVLPRRGLHPQMLMNNLWKLAGMIFLDIKSLIDDLLKGIERTFMSTNFKDTDKSKNDSKKEREELFKLLDPDRRKLESEGGPAKSKKKRTQRVFKTNIWYMVHSKERMRRGVISRSVETAVGELEGDNRLKPLRVNIRAKQDMHTLSKWKLSDPYGYNLMSVDELGKLEQLPTKELQMEFKEQLISNQRVEANVPEVFKDESGILAGTTTIKGESFKVHIPTTDQDMMFTSRAIIGSPRMGKDQLAINMIVEAKRKHGIGAIVPDVVDERRGHRGMADALRDHIPPEDIIDINLGDFDHPPYLGLQSLAGTGSNERIASNRIAQELTNFLMGEDRENHQTKEYLQEFAKAVMGDIIGVKLLCLSHQFREETINELLEKGRDVTALRGFHEMSEGRQQQIAGPILVRIQQLLGDEFLKPIFGQNPNPAIDFAKWMREGKVVILRIPSRELGEEAVKTIVYWITLVTFLTRIRMDDAMDEGGVFVVMNEPHQFMSKGLAYFMKRMFAEGPKYRIAPIVILHNFNQIEDKAFVQIMLSSSLNWHIFKNSNIKVYQELELYIEPTFTPETAMKTTKRFHYIACWLDDEGEYRDPFMVKAPDLVADRYDSYDNSYLSREHSKIYGRPIDEVLDAIQQRQSVIYTENKAP